MRRLLAGGAAAAVAALTLTGAEPVRGQTIRVGLEVTESTGGLFRESFDSALSALDEVEVTPRGEPAHYVVTVAVLCLPEAEVCRTADSYTVSVTLSEPLTPTRLRTGLGRTGTDVLSEWDASPEAAAYLQRYRQMHAAWATAWARENVPEAVGRLVRGMDARCFERRRIYETRRAGLLSRGDTAAARNLPADVVPGESWIC